MYVWYNNYILPLQLLWLFLSTTKVLIHQPTDTSKEVLVSVGWCSVSMHKATRLLIFISNANALSAPVSMSNKQCKDTNIIINLASACYESLIARV